MNIVAIIQARTGSKRLPGKVMMEVKGKPLIGYLIDRVESVRCLDAIVLAMPACDAGSRLEAYGKSRDVMTFCGGEENDVAGRFASVLRKCGKWDAFVRICGDSPLLDPVIIEALCLTAIQEHALVLSNVGQALTPAGQHAELVDTGFFLAQEPYMRGDDREHVTSHLYKSISVPSMAVDTEEDFARIENIIKKMKGDHLDYDYNDCLNLLGQRSLGLV